MCEGIQKNKTPKILFLRRLNALTASTPFEFFKDFSLFNSLITKHKTVIKPRKTNKQIITSHTHLTLFVKHSLYITLTPSEHVKTIT